MKRWDKSQNWKFRYMVDHPQIRKNRRIFLLGYDNGFWDGWFDKRHDVYRRLALRVVECSFIVFDVLLIGFDILLYLEAF